MINNKLAIAFDIPNEYLAGVADSDGSFSYLKNYSKPRKKYYYRPFFQLTWKYSKEADLVCKYLKNKYKAGLYYGIKKNDLLGRECKIIKVQMWEKSVVLFLEDILPYLILKKKQAEIVLYGAKLKSRKWGVKGKPKEIWEKEIKLYKKINSLNSKNKKLYDKR